jgi:peptidoglycan/xylan/chitin deacetylase (PgdA/CDA1 family)
MLLPLLAVVSVCGPDAERGASAVPVLIYHEIVTDGRQPRETVIARERFKEQMRYLAEHGYTTLSISQLIGFMRGEMIVPERSILLTFDDGWKSTLNALQILNELRFKALFWIITGTRSRQGYLDWSQIGEIARNPRFEIGSHTVSHPWDPLDNLVTWADGKTPGKGTAEILAELRESKETLQRRLKHRISYLAWPMGWYNDTLVDLAKATGYAAILTTDEGTNRRGGDVWRIKRLFIDGACPLSTFRRVLREGRYFACQTEPEPTRGHSPYR